MAARDDVTWLLNRVDEIKSLRDGVVLVGVEQRVQALKGSPNVGDVVWLSVEPGDSSDQDGAR